VPIQVKEESSLQKRVTFVYMSERYKVIDSTLPTFVTLTLVGWTDLFNRKIYTEILDEAFTFCIKNKALKIHAYVYMTSNIHLIVSSETNKIQDIIRDFKKYTSKKLIEAIVSYNESRREWLLKKFSDEAKRANRAAKFKVWQDGFHPVLLDNGTKIMQKLNYIHENPLETGLITKPEHWNHSSYNSYYNKDKRRPNLIINILFDEF